MKVKVCEVQSLVLDWLVAKCAGMWVLDSSSFIPHYELGRMHYSTDWAQGGPIIDSMKPLLEGPNEDTEEVEEGWWCSVMSAQEGMNHPVGQRGPTALIAAMRCYVVSKLGEEVEVPDELIVE